LTEQSTNASSNTPADKLPKNEVGGRLVEAGVTTARPDLDGRLSCEVNAFWKLEHGEWPAADLLLDEVVLA